MSFRWVFEPESQFAARKPYVPKKEKKSNSWVCPEHAKVASSMRRDYPRDIYGRRIEGKGKELVLDKRPTLLIPQRPTIMGWK